MRKQYEAPKLIVLGDIKEITQFGIIERFISNSGSVAHRKGSNIGSNIDLYSG